MIALRPLAMVVFALTGLALPLPGQDTTAAAPDTAYDYHESPISLPLGLGLRIPGYDRVNGITLPWGPKLEAGEGKFDIDALVRYRSNLGKWDPSLEGVIRPGDDNELKLFVGRGTFTNDDWIRTDLMNSLAVLGVGSDARNWYRGDRATARLSRAFTRTSLIVSPFIGGNLERDWSTGSVAPAKSPWSFFGRKGNLKMRRPNPRAGKGSITSVFGGTAIEFGRGDLEAKLDATLEKSLRTALKPDCSGGLLDVACLQPGGSFTQTTIDGRVYFPTFGTQTFTFKTHAVFTGGAGAAPAQRFAYLGGSGTLATVNLLALGGDRLLYVQGDYKMPFERIQLPYLGNPYVALTYAAGNAGIDRLPSLIQNLGVGVGVGLFRIDFSIDPAKNRSPFSRKSAFTFGASL
ncbi:MAG TPA: hypothetical protein VEK37_15910 [Gemmatimonadaceae bacterium]|nr:hypothetical protein [Gemmatimonadaceae bacterium]